MAIKTTNMQLAAIFVVSIMIFTIPAAGLFSDDSNAVGNENSLTETEETFDGITYVTYGDNVASVKCCFYNQVTANIRPEVIIGGGRCTVVAIEGGAFQEALQLSSVTIPDTVKNIGDYAFNGSSVRTITIGKGVTLDGVGVWAFHECRHLESINVVPGNPELFSINGVLFGNDRDDNGDHIQLIQYPISKGNGTYEIPGGVETIKNLAFQYSGLDTVIMNNGLKVIEDHAFIDCRNLASVTISDDVTDIGFNVFKNCPNLCDVTLGSCKITKCETSLSGLVYISIAIGATGFMTGTKNSLLPYEFFNERGEKITDESQIAGRRYVIAEGGTMIEYPGNKILYFVDGGNMPAPVQKPLVEGETFIVADYSGTKDGYKFMGWTDGTKTYLPGSTCTVGDEDVVLKAIWMRNPAPTPPPVDTDDGMPIWAISLLVIVVILVMATVAYYCWRR